MYLPWTDADLAALRAVSPIAQDFCDPVGLPALAAKQKSHFHAWMRPHEMCELPKMVHLISSFTIKQVCLIACVVVRFVVAISFLLPHSLTLILSSISTSPLPSLTLSLTPFTPSLPSLLPFFTPFLPPLLPYSHPSLQPLFPSLPPSLPHRVSLVIVPLLLLWQSAQIMNESSKLD